MDKENKQKLFAALTNFLKNKGATKVAVFCSYVRNDETPKSDIDVIAGFSDDMSLMKIVRIERELSELIGIKVDLGTTLKPHIEPYIKSEIVYLL